MIAEDINQYVTKTKDYIQIESPPFYHGGPVENFELIDKHTIYSIFMVRAKGNKHDFLGTRKYDKEQKKFLEYEYTSYEETAERAEIIGNALGEIGLKPNQFVCGFYANREEWLETDLATWRQAGACLPLRAGLNFAYYESIVRKVEPVIAFVDPDKIEGFLNMCENMEASKKPTTIKTIIVYPFPQGPKYGDPYLPEEIPKRGEKIGIKIMKWDTLVEIGKTHKHPPEKQSPDNYHTLIFTSGTTSDKLKGVLLLQKTVMSSCCRCVEAIDPEGSYYSYINHQHISEREASGAVIVAGNNMKISFASEGFKNFIDDMKHCSATLIPCPPIILKMFYQLSQNFQAQGMSEKEANEKVKEAIGGKMHLLCTYGAPSSRDLVEWAIKALDVCVGNHYGVTETGGVCIHVPFVKDLPPVNNIGAPPYRLSARLINAPEFDCLITDNPPKGEILIKTLGVTGYFKDEELTKKAVDKDGWYHTNDLGQLEANGTMTILGRKDYMIKLSSAAYVSLESIEDYFQTSPIIAIPCVYGDHLDNFLNCILNPDFKNLAVDKRLPENLKEKCINASKNPESKEALEFCQIKEVKDIYMDEFAKISKKFNFPTHWAVEGVIIAPVPWSEKNGMLTISKKVKRRVIAEKFHDELFAQKEEIRKRIGLHMI